MMVALVSDFDQPATVGSIYMLKLTHMVDDKMHARSIGPYSLLHNNHLEVKLSLVVSDLVRWRFGHLKHSVHANILREILTVKSDDVMVERKHMKRLLKEKLCQNLVFLNHSMYCFMNCEVSV